MTKHNMNYLRSVIGLMVLFLLQAGVFAQGVPRSECFPFEEFSGSRRKAAEELLLKAMDEAALYTIVGGLKPVSSGVETFRLQVGLPTMKVDDAAKIVTELGSKEKEDLTDEQIQSLSQAKQTIDRNKELERISETRDILEKWRCGKDIYADVYHFSRTFEGKRFLDVIVVNRPSLSQKLDVKQDFFSRWGLTPNSHPLNVLYAVENDTSSARFAGYGYLFGYPDHAVRFFVQAHDDEVFSGHFVTRDSISIPTYARDTGFFVYVVPKGYKAEPVDDSLRAKAAPILAEYRKRRAEYIGEGKKGVVELLRDWFCNADGSCSPSNAGF